MNWAIILLIVVILIAAIIFGAVIDNLEEKQKLKRTISKYYLTKIMCLDKKIFNYDANKNYRGVNSCNYHKLKYLDKANISDKKARKEILKYCIWSNPHYIMDLASKGWTIKED